MIHQHFKIITMDYIPEELLKKGEKIKFNANEVLKNQNESFEGIYILLKGLAVTKSLSDNGKQLIHSILKPPYVIGDLYAITGDTSNSIFEFIESSEVLYVSSQELIKLIKNDDEVFSFIFESLNRKIKTFVTQLEEIVILNTNVKIAILLFEFVTEFGDEFEGHIKIDFNLTKQLISDLIGVDRSTVNRMFSMFVKNNIITHAGRSIVIRDLEMLEKYIDNNL